MGERRSSPEPMRLAIRQGLGRHVGLGELDNRPCRQEVAVERGPESYKWG